MNLGTIAETVIKAGAPLLGAALGMPSAGIITQIIASAFGIKDTTDPVAIASAITSDPDAQVKLAQIESDQQVTLQRLLLQNEAMQNQSTLDEMRAGNQDTEDARDNNNKHRATLYFAMAVSVLVIICFYLCIYWIANHPPDPTDHDILYMLFGVGSTAFGAVINYWLGASIQNGLKPQ